MRRGRLVLMAVAALAVSACGGSSGGSSAVTGSLTSPGQYGKLPAPGTPTGGGSITFGVLNGNTVNYIFPIVPSGNASTYNYNVEQAMWLPLYNNSAYGSAPGIDYSLSLANKPVFSNGNKTVTFTLKQGYKWSNGQPVVAKDVLFDIALNLARPWPLKLLIDNVIGHHRIPHLVALLPGAGGRHGLLAWVVVTEVLIGLIGWALMTWPWERTRRGGR